MNLENSKKISAGDSASRIQKWDILKFFLIFLVVLGHFLEVYKAGSRNLQILRFWIYSFHMPLFVFITGLFAKKNIDEKRYSKISSFLLIYFVSDFLIALVNAFITGKLKYSFTTVSSVPWYAFVVFFYCLITIAVKKMPKTYVFGFAVVLACFVGYDENVGDFLGLSRMICFYPFFFAGYCLDVKKLSEALSKLPIKILSAVYITVYTLLTYFKFDVLRPFQSLLSGKHPYSHIAYSRFGGLWRLSWYVIVFIFCFCLISLAPRGGQFDKRGVIASLGRRTLSVYILHLIFIRIITNAFDLKALFTRTSYFLLIPIALAVTLLCSAKIFEKPIAYLTNPQSFARKKAADRADEKPRENKNESENLP